MPVSQEGQRIDQFYDTPEKPLELTIFASLQARFDYLECQRCGRVVQTAKLTPEEVKLWKFEMMGLRPSVLMVAKATCPICQRLFAEFQKVLRE
jgi:hypothetical protein